MSELTTTTTTVTTTLEGVDLSRQLTHALSVVLARTRCEALHAQINNGRCPNCISWAESIGAPRHAPQLLRVLGSETHA